MAQQFHVEINEETHTLSCEAKISEELCVMHSVQLLKGFQFQNELIFY
jgi:hypothetical protein